MTTLAEHSQLLTARRDWLRAKQTAYNAERARLTSAMSTGQIRDIASALVPLARELRSATERIYIALVPALYAANRPDAGTRPPDVEALRRLCEEGVRMWATAQAALQEYVGTAGQPGPSQMAPMRVPAWEAYVIGPSGLVGLGRAVAGTASESLSWLDDASQGAEYRQARAQEEAARREVERQARQQAQEQAPASDSTKMWHGVVLGVAILGGIWYVSDWWRER